MTEKPHILSVDDISLPLLRDVFGTARRFKHNEFTGFPSQRGKVVVSVFWEPSTRTATSFEAATYYLEASHIGIKGVDTTSVQKGETFEDTVRAYASYGDILVLRHPEVGAAHKAASLVDIPVINAGDGINEHPTQALLDLFTLVERFPSKISLQPQEFGNMDLVVGIAGDLSHGRTVRSLVKLLGRFEGVSFVFLSSDPFFDPPWSLTKTLGSNYEVVRVRDGKIPETTLAGLDVLYMTRVQAERFPTLPENYEGISIGPEDIVHLPESSLVMHPLPRVGEIDPAIDRDERVGYFEQMRNGKWVRAALLGRLLR